MDQDDPTQIFRYTNGCAMGDPCLEALATAQQEIERLQQRIAEQQKMLKRCLLGDPPGDCYAAEVVTLRARIAELEADVEEERKCRSASSASAWKLGELAGLRAALEAVRVIPRDEYAGPETAIHSLIDAATKPATGG